MSDFHLMLEEQVPKLMRYAAALTRDADQASELVEDTVIDALANRRDCCRGDLRVWLLTILHDLRANPFHQSIYMTGAAEPDPAGLLTLSEFDRALGQLPEEQRAAILLVGLEAMTYRETAAVLRVPVSTVRSRLARGRDGLCRALGIADAPALGRAA